MTRTDASRPLEQRARALQILLVLAIGFTGFFGVLAPALGSGGLNLMNSGWFGPLPTVTAQLRDDVQVSTSPPLPSLEDSGPVSTGDGLEIGRLSSATVTVWGPDGGQMIGLAGPSVVRGLTTVAVLVLMLRITRSLREGDPFIAPNARRVMTIGVLVASDGLAANVLGAWGRQSILRSSVISDYVEASWQVSFRPLVAGLVVMVAADVFRRGTQLRAAADGVV